MTNDEIVRGMAKEARWVLEGPNASYENAIRAALLWFADNVSDEMISAAYHADTERGNAKVYISAAIRVVAGDKR